MIKTTLRSIKEEAQIIGRAEFKKFLEENDLKPVSVQKVAYSVSIYGLGAYLVYFTLSNGLIVKVATENRSSWNYSITNSDFWL